MAQNRLKTVLAKGGRFKIGETGQLADERINKDSVYLNEYDTFKVIYTSKNKLLIDALEEELIKYAKRYYKERCANIDAISYGRMTDKNGKYCIYVVSTLP